jgi:hypothetical protein
VFYSYSVFHSVKIATKKTAFFLNLMFSVEQHL